MKTKLSKNLNMHFDRFATKATIFAGSSAAFSIACLVIVLWVISGPIFKYSDTWQLVINTGTTIITFLMVFLIQRSQNKDSMAVHLKLNELVAGSEYTSNRLVNIEDLTQDDLELLHNYYVRLAEKAKKEADLKKTHSIEDEQTSHKKSGKIKKSA
jgi:low affinity Fe/Cu permease